ncbi:MAG: riboflavin synthase subunit alpha [Candidatus Magasanikbacteria bacterium RIFOXYD2_FULL_39_9]|uniref:Riboflavin synthase n=1 Tax=Candidatus Magasanikbacteria bacterium RIFOXYD1_FULL_40_23 TaxID=1798705 RepID=A0A1F6P8U4_9BACT|nr:MAG: riboflavin synthase subunit alpha [Candidatus Magasanikbacteria bacterium RIFOXYD1_FULL_40_23]OGH93082.1 MAG: riboflavin synthase subunit alpha [Candidatus Magasanikbacteria bacterium RIFOXYD2_FULL_39_9]
MFTGIIKKTSVIKDLYKKGENLFASVTKEKDWPVELGQSISINGVCSTVKSFDKTSFLVEWMPETLKKTSVNSFKKGTMVNLETSLNMSTMLDGHIVQGHVDTVGKVIEIKPKKDSRVIKIKLPAKFMKFIADKGSVAVDGISLTVVDTGRDWFTVSLVSYTISHTNFLNTKKGDLVNIETDVLAKYIHKLLKK